MSLRPRPVPILAQPARAITLAVVLAALSACAGGESPREVARAQPWPDLAPVADFAAPPPAGDPDADAAALADRARALRLRAAALGRARP